MVDDDDDDDDDGGGGDYCCDFIACFTVVGVVPTDSCSAVPVELDWFGRNDRLRSPAGLLRFRHRSEDEEEDATPNGMRHLPPGSGRVAAPVVPNEIEDRRDDDDGGGKKRDVNGPTGRVPFEIAVGGVAKHGRYRVILPGRKEVVFRH